MPSGQRPTAASTWTIRSVSLRTRDGPERLDQVYRRLLAPPLDTSRAESDTRSVIPSRILAPGDDRR
jgi:hypothetical protein